MVIRNPKQLPAVTTFKELDGRISMENQRLSYWVKDFLQYKNNDIRSAYTRYQAVLNKFVDFTNDPLIGEVRLTDVSSYIANEGIRLKITSCNLRVSILKGFFGYVNANHIKSVSPYFIKYKRAAPPDRYVATKEDIHKIESVIDKTNFWELRKLIIFRLMWESMMRVGEVMALKMSSISPDKNFTEIVTEKSLTMRWVIWSKELHMMMSRYYMLRSQIETTSDALFLNTEGGPLTIRSVERFLKDAAKKAGVNPRLVCHSFRHGGAHELAKNGASTKFIGMMLGHSEKNTLSAIQYLRYNKEQSFEIVEKFNNLRNQNGLIDWSTLALD